MTPVAPVVVETELEFIAEILYVVLVIGSDLQPRGTTGEALPDFPHHMELRNTRLCTFVQLFFVPEVPFEGFFAGVEKTSFGLFAAAPFVLTKTFPKQVGPPLLAHHIGAAVGGDCEEPILRDTFQGPGDNLQDPGLPIQGSERETAGNKELDVLAVKCGDIFRFQLGPRHRNGGERGPEPGYPSRRGE